MSSHPGDARLNLYRDSTHPQPTETLTLVAALGRIRDGHYRTPVERLRRLLLSQGQHAYNRGKRRLAAITFCGLFSPTRGIAHLQQHSGIVHGDLDHLDAPRDARPRLCADPYTVYCFTSPSGTGLKVGVHVEPVADDAAYKRAWQAVADYYQERYGLTWDKSGKDVSRLCYVSWDSATYLNLDAPLFALPSMPIPEARPPSPPRPSVLLSADRRERYARQALYTAIDMIDRSVPGSRHAHRLRAARLLGGYIAGGILTHDEARSALAQAVARNTDDLDRSMRTIADGLAYGQAHPITLEQLEAERQSWRDAHRPLPAHSLCHGGLRTIVPQHDPWEGRPTLPLRPYTGYRGLRYGRGARHG